MVSFMIKKKKNEQNLSSVNEWMNKCLNLDDEVKSLVGGFNSIKIKLL